MTMVSSSPTVTRVKSPGKQLSPWVVERLFSPLTGMTIDRFQLLLRENDYAVTPGYWAKAAIVAAISLANTPKARRELDRFGAEIEKRTIHSPLFILGHWRSGTTLLHNLIALDERFTYANQYQVLFPNTFLSAGPKEYAFLDRLLPGTRHADNMAALARDAAEDEFAICGLSTRSPYMRAFPRSAARYQGYLTLRGVPEPEIQDWRDALLHFLKKLTVLKDAPIALKSPTHTCRVKLLLDLFPDAKFLHIHRDPYAVYQSSMHLEMKSLRGTGHFQPITHVPQESDILDRYKRVYDLYLEERSLIAPGNLHQIAYEELERDPINQLRSAYEAIGLPDFEVALPAVETYLAAQAGYQKNEFRPMDSGLKARIRDAWAPYFEEWNYPLD